MIRLILTMLLALGLVSPPSMVAHDKSKHRGKATDGEVVSVAENRFELRTATGIFPVTFSTKTKFEHGNATVDKTHVTKGTRVSVFGTKLPSGELVAREVLIGGGEKTATDTASHATHGGHATRDAQQPVKKQ